jgi:hypothetical protein
MASRFGDCFEGFGLIARKCGDVKHVAALDAEHSTERAMSAQAPLTDS